MSSYGKSLTTDIVKVDKILENDGFEKRNNQYVTVLNSQTTKSLTGPKSGFYVLSVDAASVPAAIRKVVITFTPSPKPVEINDMYCKVLGVYQQTAADEKLFVANVQRENNTTFNLRIANNDGTTNITTTLIVILEFFSDSDSI
jgi:hypothetical protein